MHHFIHRYLLLPAFESGLKRRRIFRYWKDLEHTQWLTSAALEHLQFEALRRLVAHTFRSCPYYRDEWSQRGLGPDQLRTPDGFLDWPLIDRETIRENRLRMRSQVPGTRLIPKSTGGSSGAPLHFDYTNESYDWRLAVWHRGYSWAGASPGTKQLYLWGVPLGKTPRWKRWKDRLHHGLYRRQVLNSFDFTEERVPQFLERHNRYRPDVLVAYTSPLYVFARELEARQLKPFSPKSIVVGAEKLYGFQRQLIERVFRAPVFETYGCREFMLIGAECDRHEGLHLSMENLLVEVLDNDGRPTPHGEEGNVVITDLHNYGMPFIRYANGDRAVAGWDSCSCGRGLPLLKKVEGRQLDLLQTPDGRQVPGEFFPHLMKEFPSVKRFQVIQEEPARIQLQMVLRGPWTQADRQLLDSEVRSVLGSAVCFEVLVVDDIPLTSTGKLRVVVNRCRPRTTFGATSLVPCNSRSTRIAGRLP